MYTENYKIINNEIKEGINKWTYILGWFFLDWKTHISKDNSLYIDLQVSSQFHKVSHGSI